MIIDELEVYTFYHPRKQKRECVIGGYWPIPHPSGRRLNGYIKQKAHTQLIKDSERMTSTLKETGYSVFDSRGYNGRYKDFDTPQSADDAIVISLKSWLEFFLLQPSGVQTADIRKEGTIYRVLEPHGLTKTEALEKAIKYIEQGSFNWTRRMKPLRKEELLFQL